MYVDTIQCFPQNFNQTKVCQFACWVYGVYLCEQAAHTHAHTRVCVFNALPPPPLWRWWWAAELWPSVHLSACPPLPSASASPPAPAAGCGLHTNTHTKMGEFQQYSWRKLNKSISPEVRLSPSFYCNMFQTVSSKVCVLSQVPESVDKSKKYFIHMSWRNGDGTLWRPRHEQIKT